MQLQNIVHKSIFFFCKLKLYIYLAAIYHRSQAVLNSFYTGIPTSSLPYYTIVNSKYTFVQWDKNEQIYIFTLQVVIRKKFNQSLIRDFCKIFLKIFFFLILISSYWCFLRVGYFVYLFLSVFWRYIELDINVFLSCYFIFS